MTRHHAAVCTGLACGPTASMDVPSKNQRLNRSLDVGANVAVYNECYPLVMTQRRTIRKRKVLMRNFAKVLAGVVLLAGAASAGPAPAAQEARQGLRQPDVIYVPTRQTVVDAMLKVANVKAGDLLYDLGCGEGRIPVTAAKLGAKAVCIDIDPKRIAEANENVKKNSVGDRVSVLNQDLFTTDISQASVVTLYLLPSLNLKLRPTLWKTLKPGTRI